MTNNDAEDLDRRWAEANDASRGVHTEAGRARIRRWKRWFWGSAIGLLVLAVAVGLVAGLIGRDTTPDVSPGIPLWRQLISISLLLGGLILEIVVFVRARRLGVFKAVWTSPQWYLTRKQRSEVAKAVRGKRDVRLQILPTARDLAARMAAQRHLSFMYAAFVVIAIGNLVGNWPRPSSWLFVVVLLFWACLIPNFRRDLRRAEEFLRRYPEPTPAT